MPTNKTIKKIQRSLARNGLFIFSSLFNKLPYSIVKFIGFILTSIGYCFIIRHRSIAKESINIAFGDEKSPQEVKKIIRTCFRSFGKSMIEMLYFMAHPEMINRSVSYQGKKYLEESLREGKGVIAVTAHFGNFPLMMFSCAQNGYKVSSIIRPTRDPELEAYLFRKRTECKLKTIYAIPQKKCVNESLKVLRNNEILFIPIDQNFGRDGGVFVRFFGQKAATAPGPVVLSMRTGAPILPMFIVRQNDNTHKIIIEPQFHIVKREDEKKTIEYNISRITNLIEKYIRKYPQEWGWMHRRWKSRPNFKQEYLEKQFNNV